MKSNEGSEKSCVNLGLKIIADIYGEAKLEDYRMTKIEVCIKTPFLDTANFDRYDLNLQSGAGKFINKYEIIYFVYRDSGSVE